MKNRILFIYNPLAGKSKIKTWLSSIVECFGRGNYEVVIYATKGKKDAKNIVIDCLKRESYDLVVCSGGDGTLNEVISGIMESDKKPVIGYLPSGTTNDFAYNLKLPKSLPKAAEVVLHGEVFPCDIGVINGKYFTYTAAFGLFTDASYETSQAQKNTLGRMAYILEGIKRLPNWKAYQIEIHYGERIIKDNFIYGMVTNSVSVGGFRGIAGKDVLLDDGLFEGIFVKMPQNVIEFQAVINDLLKGNLNSDHIYYFPIKNITLICEEKVPWSIDGEYGGEYNTIEIENLHKAISIVRGAD
ncbi:diacylglycerol/lipid kinase family protein [Anaerocolumna xylanovorans]|uniref:Lipid kinase, YegS/Rv2252/BmrU family n=1 Tax=Anaerocolumna xylanovorans DSM 12503 TaxID=1121345 RepID=A0A1M7YH76_9FIRM|nr:diacylglycerol kinase family protein [Anaerocolumna xylanovorans]SHO52004.1 lipid kinase, YegS/Rv2252/BmrU family [Anaerocolumna xylanovorans DSM 12503]